MTSEAEEGVEDKLDLTSPHWVPAVLIVVGWLAGVVIVIVAFNNGPQRTWQEDLTFNSQMEEWAQSHLTEDQALTFVHFLDSNCRCADPELQHIADTRLALQRQFPERSLKERVAFKNDAISVTALSGLTRTVSLPEPKQWPQVALFEGQSLRYIGPYSSGDVCGTGVDLVLLAVERSVRGEATPLPALPGSCLCI